METSEMFIDTTGDDDPPQIETRDLENYMASPFTDTSQSEIIQSSQSLTRSPVPNPRASLGPSRNRSHNAANIHLKRKQRIQVDDEIPLSITDSPQETIADQQSAFQLGSMTSPILQPISTSEARKLTLQEAYLMRYYVENLADSVSIFIFSQFQGT